MIRGSKKIIMSVLTLTLTFIALGTITFAWFSLSTVSNISNISGSVRGGEGLEVRLLGDNGAETNWRSNLGQTELNSFLTTHIPGFRFNGVSTEDGSVFTKMDTVNDKTVVNGALANKNEDYVEFTIQFKSAAEGIIKLNSFEMTGSGSPAFVSNNAYDQFEVGTAGVNPIFVDPSNGARFSLEKTIGNLPGATLAMYTYQKAQVNYYDDSGVYYGNTANDDIVLFGQYSYLVDSQAMELYYDDGVNTLPITIAGDVNEQKLSEINFLAAQTTAAGTRIELVKNEYDSGGGVMVKHINDAAADEYVAEVTIRIWLEGWDADTYDALYGGQLVLAVTFSKE